MGGGVGLGQLIKERQVRRGMLWKFVASTCTKKVKGEEWRNGMKLFQLFWYDFYQHTYNTLHESPGF